ncbi:glutamate synthase subunit beta [Paludibaculum fermentans]|uniref:Glutamate synthase subunit beta n=1 Tax=Paludibaculum fermentans TaxID=1473598 RepID=A0A7S7NKC7_PALFE|nr:glutamate synthase subunit beta [Paludibaculum fermentans]QOY85226.1 glutamate synthase subunit beta [Paludibaculum fermentans]
MGKVTGFLEFQRETIGRRPVAERLNDWFEVYQPLPEDKTKLQGARCMDCGVPFCHTGCPLTNLIPDWNDLAYRGRWKEAIRALHSTNNFPEFTSRICPAPCESACVLGINEPPVAIKTIERAIIDHAWNEGWIKPETPTERTGKRVAVVGSGPAGLAAAQQLARAGHLVTVFEKADRIGGLLRYGIPDFKMEKHHIDRRMEQMKAEGVTFKTNAHIGVDISVKDLRKEFHAVLLAGGAEAPRDLKVPGRQLKGVHFAMEYLPLNNKRNAGDSVPDEQWISAEGKNVIIIGGGDTGADCLGTSHRHKAKSIRQFEIMPMPPAERSGSTPWPLWPLMLREESSHEEGGQRHWAILTTEFLGDENGNVRALKAVKVGPAPKFEPIPGSEEEFAAELVLLAMGFVGPVKNGLIEQLGVELDNRGNVKADENYMTSVPGVFTAGDMRRGQSLVVWAMAEGRKAAEGISQYLQE